MFSVAELLISLGIILIGAEVFTNAIEWLGHRYDLSEGAMGSVLAAVGTALPETMIPLIAFLLGGSTDSVDIGVGAILGAPLMLSTLAMFITGVGVLVFRNHRSSGVTLTADSEVMHRDLGVFLILFASAILTGLLPLRYLKLIIAGFMVLAYIWYVYVTMNQEDEDKEREDLRPCYFAPRHEIPPKRRVWLQLLVSLGLIIGGAHLFVQGVTAIALASGIPAFVLSLVIAPIATELPEKFNSVIWVSRGKDTLALGNITGAMVFQGSLIPAVGIFLTDWSLSTGALITGGLAFLGGLLLYFETIRKRSLSAYTLLLSGCIYAVFLVFVFKGLIR